MNRRIFVTMALLMTASVQVASGQYGPMPGPGAPGMMPGMRPPTAPMPGPMGYGAAPLAARPSGPMLSAPIPQGMMQAPAMQAPVMHARMSPNQMMTAPVQPAFYPQGGPQAVSPVSHAGCGAGGCDSLGGGCCGSGDCCGGACSGGGCCGGGLFGGCTGNVGLGHHDKHGPYGSGGCCLPRWFDVHAEWLYWNYDFREQLPLSSVGILGPTALDANQLSMNYESGFRVSGAYLIGVGTGIEAVYMDGLNWSDDVTITTNDNLFTVFSDFGSDPLNGFPETDFGARHSLAISAQMNGGELNVRRRFVSANCHVHSSIMVGARYFRWREDLVYQTLSLSSQANPDGGEMSYQLKASNDLIGTQTGGDLWFCVSPRFKVGGDIKAGVFGTHSTARTNVFCTSCDPIREQRSASDVAFVGEGGVVGLYRVTPRLTLRAAYQVLYVTGIATTVRNFNTASPFSARDTFIDHSGDAFLHGSNLGFEFTW